MSEAEYEGLATGLRVIPGQWRPHHRFEQIAWISPAWPSQDYLWLDFPEGIFTEQGALYMSHRYPGYPLPFPDLPAAPRVTTEKGITFRRTLPNGVSFGGSVEAGSSDSVSLLLYIENGSGKPLRRITLQTCLFLRACAEFSGFHAERKFVYLSDGRWRRFKEAEKCGLPEHPGGTRVGWRGGPAIATLPVMVTVSDRAERLVAFTWYGDTYSLIGNTRRPCMHADPHFTDLLPGKRGEIHGEVIFFEGNLESFTEWFQKKWDASKLRAAQ
jgi:hypothetical protein